MNIKRLLPVLFGILITFSCNENKTTTTSTDVEKPTSSETSVAKEAPAPLKKMSFEGTFVLNEGGDGIVGVSIKEVGKTEVFQDLTDLQLSYEEGHPSFEKPQFKDLNFDGHTDLMIPESMGTANIYYAYWIYNATTKQLERNKEMTLCLPDIDHDKKVIVSNERGSSFQYMTTYYKYEAEHFVTDRTEDVTYKDEKQFQIVVNERQADGSMKETINEMRTEK